jgi:Spy/CpxP family protein refolding chaperone
MKSKVRAYLVAVVIFALGALAGGGGSFAYAQKKHAAILQDNDAGFESRRLRVLSRKLDLDDAQQERIGAILAKDREDSKALGQDMMQRCGQPLRDHKAAVDAQIRAELRPDQQTKYDQLGEERKGRVRLRDGGRH